MSNTDTSYPSTTYTGTWHVSELPADPASMADPVAVAPDGSVTVTAGTGNSIRPTIGRASDYADDGRWSRKLTTATPDGTWPRFIACDAGRAETAVTFVYGPDGLIRTMHPNDFALRVAGPVGLLALLGSDWRHEYHAASDLWTVHHAGGLHIEMTPKALSDETWQRIADALLDAVEDGIKGRVVLEWTSHDGDAVVARPA
jgi:hypothetical protein